MTAVETTAFQTVTVWVPGIPAPQGSKKAVPRYQGRGHTRQFTGRVALVESSHAVKPWREDIRGRLLALQRHERRAWPYTGPVSLVLEFVVPRPKATPKRRTPPAIKQPDLDKLTRAVGDAITSAQVWRDDSQVTGLYASKRLAEIDEPTGCRITIVPSDRAFQLVYATEGND